MYISETENMAENSFYICILVTIKRHRDIENIPMI